MVQGHPEAIVQVVVDVQWEDKGDGRALPASFAPEAKSFVGLPEALNGCGDEIDVVAICTPNGTHVDLAACAVAAGKHVVVEKPMGLTVASVESLASQASARGVHVFGVMQNRYAPAAQWLKQAAMEHLFGEVFQVHVKCLWNRDGRYYTPGSWRGTMALDGGALFTQFSHFLDILMWVFGDLDVQSAHFVQETHRDSTEFEDGGLVRFALRNGGWGTLVFSTSAAQANFESSMTVMGSQGTVRIGGQYMDKLEAFEVEGKEFPQMPPAPPANDYGGYKGSANNHHHVYANVMDVLLHGGEVATPISEGLAVVRAIEAMHRLGRKDP